MSPKKTKSSLTPLLIALGISAAVLFFGLSSADTIDSQDIANRLLWPLARLILFIGMGLFVGQVLEATGWTRTLAVLARPLFRFGRLGDQCGAAFTAAFFSGVTANGMLLEFYEASKINRKQLFLSNFINQLPAFFLHLPTTFFIVIPLTGWAGVLYFAITFLAVLLRTVLFLIYGHFRLPFIDQTGDKVEAVPAQNKLALNTVWIRIRTRLPRRLARIAVYVIPIYVLVFVLNILGLFQHMREALAGYVVTTFMPMESLSVIILSFAAEFTSGFAAAGALLEAGILSVKQTVMALLIGNVLAFPIRALRHQLPRYIGIFSPKMGTQMLLMGQGFRVTSIILVGLVYFYIG